MPTRFKKEKICKTLIFDQTLLIFSIIIVHISISKRRIHSSNNSDYFSANSKATSSINLSRSSLTSYYSMPLLFNFFYFLILYYLNSLLCINFSTAFLVYSFASIPFRSRSAIEYLFSLLIFAAR
jgi:hypothetical protein